MLRVNKKTLGRGLNKVQYDGTVIEVWDVKSPLCA
jgi:hypothetical protein